MMLNRNIKGYILTQWLGAGGMGEVYLAQHQITQKLAAVKLLYRKDQVARFKNEAYIQSSVQHPNIAGLYEFVIDNETPCIVMEYVEGITLEKLLKRQGRLPESYIWKIMIQIVAAVAHLHQKGIIHRDLKLANIKINRDGTPKLLDFGIAKNAYTPKLTQEGFIVGTSHYMAPEQFNSQVSTQSDNWALGVMMYELMTGLLPFNGKNDTDIRMKIEKGNFMQPDLIVPELSKNSKKLIQKLLKVNSNHRMTSLELLSVLKNPETINDWNIWGRGSEIVNSIKKLINEIAS